MTLSEILNSNKKLSISRDTERTHYAQATFGGRVIEFRLDKFPQDPKGGRWQFTFVELDNDSEHGETYKKTGNGNELPIFSTAKTFLSDFIEENKPIAVYFEADKQEGSSRVKLYRRFAKRWTPTGYQHEIVHDDAEMEYHMFSRIEK